MDEPVSVPFWLLGLLAAFSIAEAGALVWFFGVLKEARERGDGLLREAVKGIQEQIVGVTSLANLALNQVPEFRAEMADKFVSKEGFREAIANLSQTVKTGFDHLTEVNSLNFRRLEERISDLQRTSDAIEAGPTRPRRSP